MAIPGDWLGALRGLRDNPVRAYLRATQRRRKLPFWLRPDLIYFVLFAVAAIALIDFCVDLVAGIPFSDLEFQQLEMYRMISVYVLGVPLLLLLLQGLYLWVSDTLGLFVSQRHQPFALPEELSLLPIRDADFVIGALSVLLPLVFKRLLALVMFCYICLPWQVLAQLEFQQYAVWPPLSRLWSLDFPVGVILVLLSSLLCMLTLTCLLLCASHRRLPEAVRIVCATGLPLIQIGAIYLINVQYWDVAEWRVLRDYRLIILCAYVLPLLVFFSVSSALLAALRHLWAKSLLALVTVFLPVLIGIYVLLWLPTSQSSSEYVFPAELPAAWASGFLVLVTPFAVPDAAYMLADSELQYEFVFKLKVQYPWLKGDQESRQMARLLGYEDALPVLGVWPRACMIHFLVLLVLATLSLEAARHSVAQWRRAG